MVDQDRDGEAGSFMVLLQSFYSGETGMDPKVEELAAEIAALDEAKQKALFELTAELNFRQGLVEISERYRKRLQQQGDLDRAAEDILAALRQIREEIAAREYPG